MNLEVLNILEKRQIKNDPTFPFWLYKTEEVLVSKKCFIKAFLFNKEFDHKNIEQVTFIRNGVEYSINKFNVVSEYKDENIVGVAFEIPTDDLAVDITIVKEVVDDKTYISTGNLVTYSENKPPREDDYLKEKIEGYKAHHAVYPNIADTYWQCSCGRIHLNDCDECSCGLTKEIAEEIVNFNFEENHIKDWCEKTIKLDINKPFQENIDNFVNDFSTKYGIDGQKLLDRLNIEKENIRYTKLVEEDKAEKEKAKKTKRIIGIVCGIVIVALTCVFTLIPSYRSYFKYRFLTSDYQEKYIGLSSLNTLDSQNQANNAFKKRMRSLYSKKEYKQLLNMIRNDSIYVTSIEGSVNLYVFHDDDLKDMYKEALYQYSIDNLSSNDDKDIESSITNFTYLSDYKDSKNKLNDAKWAFVKKNYDSTNLRTYRYLKELIVENYDGAEDAFKELYDWKVKVTINNGASSVKYYEYTEAKIEVSGGEPDTTKRMGIKVTYPNGEEEYEDWGTIHSGGFEYSFCWENGCMTGLGPDDKYLWVSIVDENKNILEYDYIKVIK